MTRKLMRKTWTKEERKEYDTGYWSVYYDLRSDVPEYSGRVDWTGEKTSKKTAINPKAAEWRATWYQPINGRNWQTSPVKMTLANAKQYVIDRLDELQNE